MDAQQDRTSPKARNRRYRIAALVSLTLALVAGILALTVPAVAQTGSEDSADDGDPDRSTEEQGADKPALAARLNAALEPLVTAGTITAEQRDAVIEALLSARRSLPPGDGFRRHDGRGSGVPLAPVRGGADLLDLLGVTRSDLLSRVRAGETLADVAAAAGVDVSAVVDLLAAPLVSRAEAAVEAGRLEEGSLESCVQTIEVYVTALVNGEETGDDADLSACSNGASHWRGQRNWSGRHDWSGDGGPSQHWGRGGRGRSGASARPWPAPPAAA